jgi:hypothetical protein
MTEDRSKQATSHGVTRRQVLGAGAAADALLATGLVFPEVAAASPERRHKGRGTAQTGYCTHRNTVRPYGRSAGSAISGGLWEINTAAHIDWPQQARVVEPMDNGDETLSVFGTSIDHAAPLSDGRGTPDSPLELASLSRELGATTGRTTSRTPMGTVVAERSKTAMSN